MDREIAWSGELDVTEGEMLESLLRTVFPEPIYGGPGAFTAKEIGEARKCSEYTAAKRSRERVNSGEVVQVKVKRIYSRQAVNAWVQREVYEAYMNQGGAAPASPKD